MASSLAIAIILRISEKKSSERTVVIAANYIVAATIGYLLTGNNHAPIGVYALGAVLGLFFFLAFVLYSKAIKNEGLAGAVTMSRISLAIPVVLSITMWGEQPTAPHLFGLALIIFIILSWEGKIGKTSPLLLAVFAIFGLLDSAMKFFKTTFPSVDVGFFLVILFFSAIIWSWTYILITGKTIRPRDIATGLALGVPNFFSFYFILEALINIPAYIAFPFKNVSIIMLSAFIGFWLFNERLSFKRTVLIVMGILAVFFLTAL